MSSNAKDQALENLGDALSAYRKAAVAEGLDFSEMALEIGEACDDAGLRVDVTEA